MKLKESHPIIKAILTNEFLEDEHKVLAISELLNLEDKRKLSADDFFSLPHTTIDPMFLWEVSELGVDFWRRISLIVFEEEGTCGN